MIEHAVACSARHCSRAEMDEPCKCRRPVFLHLTLSVSASAYLGLSLDCFCLPPLVLAYLSCHARSTPCLYVHRHCPRCAKLLAVVVDFGIASELIDGTSPCHCCPLLCSFSVGCVETHATSPERHAKPWPRPSLSPSVL